MKEKIWRVRSLSIIDRNRFPSPIIPRPSSTMATLITDSNPIQLGLQNDESNLIRNRSTVLGRPSTFSPGCARLTLLYIYIERRFWQNAYLRARKIGGRRTVGEREIGWSRWLNSSLEIELLRLERGWMLG